MNEKQIMSVSAEGITESERVILKLIFSVSQRIHGRSNGYQLADQDQANADILITSNDLAHSVVGDDSSEAVHIYLAGGSADSTGVTDINSDNILRRPLIATRTIALLDAAVRLAQVTNNSPDDHDVEIRDGDVCEDSEQPSPASLSSEMHNQSLTPEESLAAALEEDEAIGLEEVLLEEPLEDFEFSITEEEASELAIVADDSLTNPANNELIEELAKNKTDVSDEADVSENKLAEDEITVENDKPEKTAQPTLTVLHSNASTDSIKDDDFVGDETSAIDDASPRVLVVDDSPSVRKQLELELAFFSANVDYAGDACVANDLLKNNHYDVAFLDVVLPDGDGFEICKSVKANSKNTSVIMLTGKATPADKIKGTLAGCDAYLVKPVGRTVFQEAVKNYLTLLDSVSVMEA